MLLERAQYWHPMKHLKLFWSMRGGAQDLLLALRVLESGSFPFRPPCLRPYCKPSEGSESPTNTLSQLRWSAEETKLLRSCVESGKSVEEVLAAFPNRTAVSIKKKWYRDGPRDENGRLIHSFKDYRYRYFTEDETRRIQELWATGVSRAQLKNQFPERTLDSLTSYIWMQYDARQQDYRDQDRKNWGSDDVQRLRDLRDAEQLSFASIATRLGRTAKSVKEKHKRISKGSQRPRRIAYTPQEDSKILQMISDGSLETEAQAAFPSRPLSSVMDRAEFLRNRPAYQRPIGRPKKDRGPEMG